jgi:hypothetical protein
VAPTKYCLIAPPPKYFGELPEPAIISFVAAVMMVIVQTKVFRTSNSSSSTVSDDQIEMSLEQPLSPVQGPRDVSRPPTPSSPGQKMNLFTWFRTTFAPKSAGYRKFNTYCMQRTVLRCVCFPRSFFGEDIIQLAYVVLQLITEYAAFALCISLLPDYASTVEDRSKEDGFTQAFVSNDWTLGQIMAVSV